jgi:hypothetical protein
MHRPCGQFKHESLRNGWPIMYFDLAALPVEDGSDTIVYYPAMSAALRRFSESIAVYCWKIADLHPVNLVLEFAENAGRGLEGLNHAKFSHAPGPNYIETTSSLHC